MQRNHKQYKGNHELFPNTILKAMVENQSGKEMRRMKIECNSTKQVPNVYGTPTV